MRFIKKNVGAIGIAFAAAWLLFIPAPANACTQRAPPLSYCGDPGCARVVCLTADNSWDCNYSAAGTACTGGWCDGGGYCTSNPPIVASTYDSGHCGCVDATWNAPRGALVLIESAGSAVKTIITALGEKYTHEMISQGPGSAAQSEYKGPTQSSSCNYPLDISSLEYGFPGMEKSMNIGAIYADLYGGNGLQYTQTSNDSLIWQLGDTTRATAIADALDAAPVMDVQVYAGNVVHRILKNGSPSPYGLHQFMDIETLNLGSGGSSLNNTSVSSTFIAYAYALGGPPMTAYDYGHDETVRAAFDFRDYVYNECYAQVPWYIKGWANPAQLFGCGAGQVCQNTANMILNCTALGGAYCGSSWVDWGIAMNQSTTHARSISPDRLGGHTRFMNENPRPTTYAADPEHFVSWNAGGRVCGCFE